MFFLINLNGPKGIIPRNWINDFNEANWLNYGAKKTKKYLVFFAGDANAIPDFNIDVRPAHEFGHCLDANENGCFYATIEKMFRKYTIICFQYFVYICAHNKDFL